MAISIGRLVVEILAKTSSLEADIKRAQRSLDGFQRTMAGVTAGAATVAKAFGSWYVLSRVIDMTIELGKEMFKIHEKIDGVRIALKTATGSALGSAQEMAYLRQEADRLGLVFVDLAVSYKKFAASTADTPLAGQKTREMFSALAEAATVYRLSVDDTNGVMKAMVQVMSKGSVQSEELRGQLAERIPGAFRIAANSMGMSTDELNKKLELGLVNSVEFAEKFLEALRKIISGEVTEATGSATAALNRMTTAWQGLWNAVAKSGVMDVIVAGMNKITGVMTYLEKRKGGVIGDVFFDDIKTGNESADGLLLKLVSLNQAIGDYERLMSIAKGETTNFLGMKPSQDELYAAFDKINKIINHGQDNWPKTFEYMEEGLKKAKHQAELMLNVFAGMEKDMLGKSEFEKNKKKPMIKSLTENELREMQRSLDEHFNVMLDDESKSLDDFNKKLEDAKKLYESLVTTPADKFQEDIEKLHFLAETGAISWEKFGIAAEEALLRMGEAWDKYNKKHDESSEIYNNMKKNVEDGAEGVINAFVNMEQVSGRFYLENERRAATMKTLFIDLYNVMIKSMLEYIAQYIIIKAKEKIIAATSSSISIAQARTEGAAIAQSMAPAAIASSIATKGMSSYIGTSAYLSGLALGISATKAAGVAHDGMDNIPREGTYLLDKGERVISPEQNKILTDYLNNQKRMDKEGYLSETEKMELMNRGTKDINRPGAIINSGGNNVYNINVTLNSNSIDARGMDQVAKTLAPRIKTEIDRSNRNRLVR